MQPPIGIASEVPADVVIRSVTRFGASVDPALRPPAFTVVVAAFNHEAFLVDALKSVHEQAFRNFNVVLVDDGSSDSTLQVLHEWAQTVSSSVDVTVISIDNAGQSRALEVATAHATGDWIALLDSDDIWLPEKLERVSRELSQELSPLGPTMVAHRLEIINEAGTRTGVTRPLRAELSDGDVRGRLRSTARHVAPATSGVCIRRDVVLSLIPMATRTFREAADAYLTFGATLAGPVVGIEETLGYYRIHSGGQYLKRMLTPEGLARTTQIQRTIARHFGLEERVKGNSYFQRNEFALKKLTVGGRELIGAHISLLKSVLRDRSFGFVTRVAFALFWLVAGILPKRLFLAVWREVQIRHSGQSVVTTDPLLS